MPRTSLRRLRARRSSSVPAASMWARCSSIFVGQLLDPLAPRRLGAQDRHLPAFRVVGEGKDAAHLAHHRVGHRVVGLVDDDDVGDLHHPGLQRLDRVAGARHQGEHDRVGVVDDVDLGLADADGLDQDVVLAGGVHRQRDLEGGLGEAPERAARGHRTDEDPLVEEVVGEADPVAEQGALREGARGVDREHRHLAVGLAQLRGQRPDQGALADPGRAGEADDAGLAGAGVDLADQLPAGRVVGLDQGDRPREGALVPGDQALGERRGLGGIGGVRHW